MPNKSSKQTQKEESIYSRTKLPGHYRQAHWPQSSRTRAAFYSFTTTEGHNAQASKNTSLRSNLGVFLARKFCVSMYSWLTAGLGGPAPVVVLNEKTFFLLGKATHCKEQDG